MTAAEAVALAESFGLTADLVIPAPVDVPHLAGIDHIVTVCGRTQGHVDELDTVQRMAMLGPLTRTGPHSDGYVWRVVRDNVKYVSRKMFVAEGEVGWKPSIRP